MVPTKSTVLQACEKVGIQIPRFCYHQRLQIAGNCRMCLAEIDKSPKPQASCALPVVENMRIFTDTPLVRKAREGVLEFLLVNHPLDCPICDQGGECDLQDQTIAFGSDRSRFYEMKRGVEDKYLGPFIKTIMTRCIHCTRCVRFAEEIMGDPSLGTTIRGRSTEIGTYVPKILEPGLSGNLIDLCPVGALTSKPYAFQGRPWELHSTDSIDVQDSQGGKIRVQRQGNLVVRILPRPEESQEWISDKARFCYDSLSRQRLNRAYFRQYPLHTWMQLAKLLKTLPSISFIAGGMADLETLVKLKSLSRKIGWDVFNEEDQGPFPLGTPYFQSTVNTETFQTSDSCLLVGVNPKWEASLLNLRIRQKVVHGELAVAAVGNPSELTYGCSFWGLHPGKLVQVVEGSHPRIWQRSLVIYGQGVRRRQDASSIFNLCVTYHHQDSVKNWLGLICVGLHGNTIGGLGVGLSKLHRCSLNLPSTSYWMIGTEDPVLPKGLKSMIFQGSQGDETLKHAEWILPTASILEKTASYVNLEGEVQRTRPSKICVWPADASLLSWVGDYFQLKLEPESLLPHQAGSSLKSLLSEKRPGKVWKTLWKSVVRDPLRTNRWTRLSPLLAQASRISRQQHWNFAE